LKKRVKMFQNVLKYDSFVIYLHYQQRIYIIKHLKTNIMKSIFTVQNRSTEKFITEVENYMNDNIKNIIYKVREREFYTDFIFTSLSEEQEDFIEFICKSDMIGY